MISTRALGTWVVAAAALVLAGCDPGLFEGIHTPRGAPIWRVESEKHFELVPEAAIVREDTTPISKNGRWAFKPGTDRLLVVTQISHYTRTDPEGRKEVQSSVDRRERVWIAIPLDAKVGQTLKLEDLETLYRTAYDAEEPTLKGMFVQPCKLEGTLTLLEEHKDHVVMQMNMSVSMAKWGLPAWSVSAERQEVPVAPQGIHATRWRPPAVAGQPDSMEAVTPVTILPRQPGVGEAVPPGVEPPPAGTQPAPGGAGPAQTTNPAATATQPAEVSRPITGKWIGETPGFELRFQFDRNGKFIYASTRGGGNYAPGMKYGTYEVKHNWVVMSVDRFEFDGQDHMKFLDPPHLYLKIVWRGENLLLEGDFKDREGKAKVEFKKAYFEDMSRVLPPRGRGWKG